MTSAIDISGSPTQVHIVFLGNCQAAAMRHIIDRFVAPYEPITTEFIDAFNDNNQAAIGRLKRAGIVVAQASCHPQPLGHEHIPQGAPVHLIPTVSGAFLYPYQGVLHPAHPVDRDGATPYMPEYCDRYLAKLYTENVAPAEALARYKAHDVAASARLGRVYELTLEDQRRLDSQTGFACAELIETYLQQERLFQSAYHFDGRIARHIGALLCDRLGFDPKYGQRIRDFLYRGPFVPIHVPVHPSVAAFFGLSWATEDRRYPFWLEGGFTFDEYVLRFMQAQWSRALQEGIEDARARLPGARKKLETGLREAPRSAEGAHELSRILEEEGDLTGAVELQRRAAALTPHAYIPFRLGVLLQKAGDVPGSERAFKRALELDPVSPKLWTAWTESLRALGREAEAKSAARRGDFYRIRPRMEGERPRPQNLSRPGSQAVSLAHVQNIGDVPAGPDGWIGRRGSRLAIEGFSLVAGADAPRAGLRYQAVFQDGSLSEPVAEGEFCGTRGQSKPIYGLLLSLDDAKARTIDIAIEAAFVSGEYVDGISAGVLCTAASPAPLEAIRLSVHAPENKAS